MDIMYSEFSKPFDKVPRQLLITTKLKSYDIGDSVAKCIKGWLTYMNNE